MDSSAEDIFAEELEALNDIENEEVHTNRARSRLPFSSTPPATLGLTPPFLNESFTKPFNSSVSAAAEESFCVSGTHDLPGKLKRSAVAVSSDQDYGNQGRDEETPRKKRQRPINGNLPLNDAAFTHRMTPRRTVQPADEHGDTNYAVLWPHMLKRIPVGPYVSVTSESGKRAYMSLMTTDPMLEDKVSHFENHQLLGVPFDVVLELANAERQKRLDAECGLKSHSEPLVSVSGDEMNGTENTSEKSGSLSLWVDRYSPRSYIDLLSEEGVNRMLLKWLKLWDYVVFNKLRPKLPKVAAAGSEGVRVPAEGWRAKEGETPSEGGGRVPGSGRGSKANQPSMRADFGKRYPKKNADAGSSGSVVSEVIEEPPQFDQNYKPLQKVALLCGRPGLGKTTLAHIVARHAGYNVIEVNASDDRSAEVFKDRIESATKMKAILGEDPKPNCLIIDEIDGAPQAAINVLLAYINGKPSDVASESQKKKKKQPPTLNRPVICVCNDLYVPALRQLRMCANVIHFPTSCPARLSLRLMEICKHEHLQTDLASLLALCEKAGNDIRSCVNTLQFVRSRKEELSMSAVLQLSVGQKDEERTLFSLWQEIFQLPRTAKKSGWSHTEQTVRQGHNGDGAQTTCRHNHIQRAAQACSDNEKLVQGLFDNYLLMKFKDPHLLGINSGCEWLCFYDELTREIKHHQYYQLCGYLSYLSVVFHLTFAATSLPKISYPHRQAELKQKRQNSENLVASMLADASPSIAHFLTDNAMVMDILPNLMDIIQPSLRPVNVQLYSAREREQLRSLVDVMIAYNVTYRQQRDAADGQYSYILEPNVEEVVRFPDSKARGTQLTYGAKQLVAREVELEKMRRSERATADAAAPPLTCIQKTGDSSIPAAPTPTTLPNYKQKLQPLSIARREKEEVCKDFFGRIMPKKEVAKETVTCSEGAGGRMLLQGDIWFKFKEGFSNAVRKNVWIKDLL